MITRSLIRVKVLQTIYSYVTSRPEYTPDQAVDDLQKNFDRSYELYYYLLSLPIELTYMQERRLDDAKHKFRPTEADLHPNMRFVDNAFVAALSADEQFTSFCKKHRVTWADDPIFMSIMLGKVLDSDIYTAYMATPSTNFESDCELWNVLLRNLLLDDDDLAEQVEKLDSRWCSEDLDTMGQFALKTIRRFQRHAKEPITLQFKDEQDREFGITLLEHAINELAENDELIDSLVCSERWDKNRVALMDRLIMDIAISEMKTYHLTISPVVTLNEYIELAKIFSTAHSGQFVNGVLHKAALTLESQQKITFWRPDTGEDKNKT